MSPVHAWRDPRLSGTRESRRATPRIEVEAVLTGCLAERSLPMVVHDLGFGGFSIESARAFAVGSRHDFRFTGPDDMVVEIAAEAVYSKVVSPRDGADRLLSGFKFVLDTAASEHGIGLLVTAALSPISFE